LQTSALYRKECKLASLRHTFFFRACLLRVWRQGQLIRVHGVVHTRTFITPPLVKHWCKKIRTTQSLVRGGDLIGRSWMGSGESPLKPLLNWSGLNPDISCY
jgi:hypothetical protein